MTLIALDARDAFAPMPHGSGVYVRELLSALRASQPAGGPTLWALTEPSRAPEVIWEQGSLAWKLRSAGADLIHGPDSFLPLARRCPGVVTIHDLAFAAIDGDMPWRTQRKYRTLVPAAARSAEAVICPSQFTAGDLERRYGIDRAKIRVIPEAPALAHEDLTHGPAEPRTRGPREPRGPSQPPAGPYVLAAGDLRPKKNLGVLVQAFKRLHAEGVPHRLILAGADLGCGAELAELAGGAPVEFPGFVGDAELDALIRGADALVVPGFYEGFGLVALDAMARGTATVLARAGALPEVGGDGAAYFDPWDLGDLVEVLGRLLDSPVRRATLSVAGRARAQRFSWAATAAATWRVYEELL